jgi:hypothetical protein
MVPTSMWSQRLQLNWQSNITITPAAVVVSYAFRAYLFMPMTEHDIGGNVHHTSEKEHPSGPEGLADKLKHKIVGKKLE